MSADLLPCPFCGGTLLDPVGDFVLCTTCGAKGPNGNRDIETLARMAWNTRADRWIPVSERLPEGAEFVIVHGGLAYYHAEAGCWYSVTAVDYPGRAIGWSVTHWRPLPAPPEAT